MNRRFLILGAAALIAAPAVVRAESLMKLYVPRKPEFWQWPLNQTIMTKLEYADEVVGPVEYVGYDVFALGMRVVLHPKILGPAPYEAILERLRA